MPCGEFTNENVQSQYETGREHMGDTGPEPDATSTRDGNDLQNRPVSGGAESGAESVKTPPVTPPTDADLAGVVKAWPSLPDALKAGIVAMVKAAAPASGQGVSRG